jgi:hypothetical protein
MKLGDFFIAVVTWCALVILGVATVRFIDRQHEPQLEIANTSSGAWNFNDAAVGDGSEPASVVPWTLNTRCTINSRNLPMRDPERKT